MTRRNCPAISWRGWNHFSEGRLDLEGEYTGKPRKPPEHWENLSKDVSAGDRNDAAASYIGKLLSNARDPFDKEWLAMTFQHVAEWNTKNRPPLPEKELRTTWDSIKRIHQNKHTAGETSAASAAASEPSNDETEQERQLRICRLKLKLPDLIAVHRQQGEQGEYELVLASGRHIVIGSAAKLLSVSAVRERIFDEVGQLIPMDKREWPQVAKALREMAIDVGRSVTERLSEWLDEFLQQHNADRRIPDTVQRGTPEWWLAVIKAVRYGLEYDHGGLGGVRDETGRIWVHAGVFARFVRDMYQERLNELDMRKLLSRAKFESGQEGQKAQRDENGKKISVRLWGSPTGWV